MSLFSIMQESIYNEDFSKSIFHESCFSLKRWERIISKKHETPFFIKEKMIRGRASVRYGTFYLDFMSAGPIRMKKRWLIFFWRHFHFNGQHILTNYSLSQKYQWWAACYQIHLSKVPAEFHWRPLLPCQSRQPEEK